MSFVPAVTSVYKFALGPLIFTFLLSKVLVILFFVTVNVLGLVLPSEDLPVQYKPAKITLEQFGIAPFSFEKTKFELEEKC